MVKIKKLPFLKKLWPHQVKAIEEINKYISNKDWNQSCMIALPTGVGKTGIIATYSHYSNFKRVLVLSPRISISGQNKIKIDGEFFKNINYSEVLPLKVLDETPTDSVINDKWIWVSTIQMISSLFRKDSSSLKDNEISFQSLKKCVDLLIIDEGHWEPANVWQKSLREFECPKILFTATPIRNDYNQFTFHESIFSIPIEQFQREKYLKSVKFHAIEKFEDENKFINSIKKIINDNKQVKNNKILVRCESKDEVEKLSEMFASAYPKMKVLGLHVGFKKEIMKKNYTLSSRVPSTENEKKLFDVYVHQYKLIEGFDDPQFGFLVLYSPFKNTRQLIQQVGRILRNPKREKGQFGHVIYPQYSYQEVLWNSFLEYDSYSIKEKQKVLNTMNFSYSEALFNKVDSLYIEGLFRNSFKKQSKINYEDKFLLPLSCVLKKKRNNAPDVVKIYEEVLKVLNSSCEVLFDLNSKNTFLIFFLEIENSAFLNIEHSIETKTQMIYFLEDAGCYAFYSSTNKFNDIFDKNNYGSDFVDDVLLKLISPDQKSKISNIYLKNSALSKVQYSSKKLWANDIKLVPASFDDSFYTPSNVWGYSYEDKIFTKYEQLVHLIKDEDRGFARRYVGNKTGRVTEDGKIQYKVPQFEKWVKGLIGILNAPKAKPNKILNRYATEVLPPSGKINAYMIAFDFDQLLELIDGKYFQIPQNFDAKQNNANLIDIKSIQDLSNKSMVIDINGIFTLEQTEYFDQAKFKLNWNASLSKFIITCLKKVGNSFGLVEVYEAGERNRKQLLDLINSKQAFKVFVRSEDALIYLDKKFVKPKFKVNQVMSNETDPVLSALRPVIGFEKIIDEKGENEKVDWKNKYTTWPKTCSFGMIASLGSDFSEIKEWLGDKKGILICDDMKTECADFIALSSKRLSLIHCKSVPNPYQKKSDSYGAGNLTEVIAQATKNLGIINQVDQKIPKEIQRLGVDEWELNKGNAKKAKINRIIKGDRRFKGQDFWNKYISPAIINPRIDKYVVCVLTHSLSYKKIKSLLEDQEKSGHTEALHSYFLILNLINVAQQIGARVEIYCDP